MKEKRQKTTCVVHDEGSRRDFLGKASCAVIAALAASGIGIDQFAGFSIEAVAADAEQGNERSYSLPSEDAVSIDQGNDVILVRSKNRVYAFALACPHENTALRWRPQDQRFQCPRHKSKYQPDGTFMGGRATRNMDRFALRLEGQKIVVDLSHLYRSDKQKSEWDSAVVAL